MAAWHQERVRRGVRAGRAHADPGVRGHGRARDRRGLRGPDVREVAAAHAQGHQPPGEVGRPARHLAARDGPHHVAGRRRAARPPRSEGRRAHRSGQASLGDAPVGSDSAEMWVSIDPSADYGKTVKAVKDVVAGYPGFHHEVTTYTKNRMTDVLGPTQRRDHGPGLRQRQPRHAPDRRPRTSRRPSPARTAWSSARHRLAADRADDGGRGRPGEGQGGRDQARRRPPRRGDACCRASGSATSSRTRRSSTWSVWSTPDTRSSLSGVAGPADRHARRRPRPPR